MKGKEIVKMIFMVFSCCFVIGCVSINWTLEDVPYGEETLQSVNIIMPKDQNNVHAVIYIHGGFYFSGNKLWHPLFLTEFAEKNIFASINYRLISGKENTVNIDKMLSDVNNALIKIKNTAEENGITIKDFILTGHSSGGHLALLYAYKYLKENNNDTIKIAACVSLAGPADYRDDFGWSSMSMYGNTVEQRLKTMSWIGTELTGYSMELTQYDWNSQNNYAEYLPYIENISPIMYVNENVPPTLLVHGTDDRCVPYSNSIKLQAALDKYSIPNKLITTSGTGNNHMLGGKPNRTDAVKPITYKNETWVNDAKEWIIQYLR